MDSEQETHVKVFFSFTVMLQHSVNTPYIQALEFFFFAACIGGLAILFAVMSFFYKYVDLSTHNQLQPEGEGDEVSSDETQALILSHDKGQEQKLGREKNEEGNESEF